MGSGHRAGGADLASGVDAAGTVARIDLRLLHHPVCEAASAGSDAPARITLRLAPTRPASAATRQPPGTPCPTVFITPPPLGRRCPPCSLELPTARAASGCGRCNGPPASREQERASALVFSAATTRRARLTARGCGGCEAHSCGLLCSTRGSAPRARAARLLNQSRPSSKRRSMP